MHVLEQLFLLLEVNFFFLLDFDLDYGFELAHELLGGDLARLIFLHLIEERGKETG